VNVVYENGVSYNGDVFVSVVYYNGAGQEVKANRFHPFEHEDRDLFLRSAERVAQNIVFPMTPAIRKAVIRWSSVTGEIGIVLHAPRWGGMGCGC